MAKEKISPGMQQYLDIKENYPDAFFHYQAALHNFCSQTLEGWIACLEETASR